MANGIRTSDPHRFNKGCSSKFCEGFWVRQTPEEGWRTYWPKCCGNNNKDEENSLKTLNDSPEHLTRRTAQGLIHLMGYLLQCLVLRYTFLIFSSFVWWFPLPILSGTFTPTLADGLLLNFKWQQLSRTFLSILTNLNNAVVWMVSTYFLIFKSSSPFTQHFGIVLSTSITIGILVTFIFYSFLSSLARSKFLSLFSFSLIFFSLWSACTIYYYYYHYLNEEKNGSDIVIHCHLISWGKKDNAKFRIYLDNNSITFHSWRRWWTCYHFSGKKMQRTIRCPQMWSWQCMWPDILFRVWQTCLYLSLPTSSRLLISADFTLEMVEVYMAL